MWYAIQTMTGREQELIDTVNARTDHSTYERCFCVRREAVWRRGGNYIPHVEALFPGYIFAETEDPEAFYLQLKKIPGFSRFLGKNVIEKKQITGKRCKKTENETMERRDGRESACERSADGYGLKQKRNDEIIFHAITEEEESFLKRLIGGDPENIVRLSPVELDENGEIVKCGGALRYYQNAIIKKRIRLRYVIVRIPFFGRDREILLGIRVEKEKILNDLDMD